MPQNVKVLVYPVKDAERAKKFYSKFLGVEPYVSGPYYIGFKIGELEVGLDPHASVGPIAYIDVSDIRGALDEMKSAGAEIVQDAMNVGGGLFVARIRDAEGNILGLRGPDRRP